MSAPRCMLAEAMGTFFLCFAGIGAILSNEPPISSGAGLIGIALAHGLALSVAVNAFGGISGAHFNPAVTVGMLITGRIKFDGALQYILAQLAGACIAAWACQALWPADAVASAKLGIPLPGTMPAEGVDWPTVPVIFMVEFILTFLLMTAIFGTAVDGRGKAVKIGGFGIGLTVAFDILCGGPITGASMNPARSFGPALMFKLTGGDAAAGAFELHWCYWAAPIAGAVVAALLYDNFLLSDDE
ncbi:MAG: aquaporin [Planctomycetota bacterium]